MTEESPLFLPLTKKEVSDCAMSPEIGYEGPLGCVKSNAPYIILDSNPQAFLVNRAALQTDRYQTISKSIRDEAKSILLSLAL